MYIYIYIYTYVYIYIYTYSYIMLYHVISIVQISRSISRSSISIDHTSPFKFHGTTCVASASQSAPLRGPGGDLVVVAQVSEDGKVDEPGRKVSSTVELPSAGFLCSILRPQQKHMTFVVVQKEFYGGFPWDLYNIG